MKKIGLFSLILVLGTSLMAQNYKVNGEKSTVKWVGKKIGKQHNGTVGLKEGSFKIEDNRFVSGTFIIDLNVMTDESSSDPLKPSRLVGHLKSDDFFNVEKYPEAKLEIIGSEPFEKGESKVKGNLTIRGITHPLEFKVLQKGAIFSSSLVFDRSIYDVKYGSGKIFQDLGDKAIQDEIAIDVSLVAERQR
jgi:polyisoprenoid-binding protein YceI